MLSDMGTSTMLGNDDGTFSEDLGKELELLLQEQRRQEASDREKELNLYRSGSAPPTVEGSFAAVGSLFGHVNGDVVADLPDSKNRNGFLSEEELRSDPAYLSYYYAHVKLNPRLPPPVLSKEDMRLAHRLQVGGSAFGGIGDGRNVNRDEDGGSKSLFSLQPRFSPQQEELRIEPRKLQKSSEWLEKGGDGLIGLSGLGLGGRQKSLVELFQDDLGRTKSVSGLPSRPASCNAFDNDAESLGSAEAQLAQLHQEMASAVPVQSIGGIQSISGSNSFASPLAASLSRSATPDPQLVARAPSPRLPPVGERYSISDKKVSNGSSSFNASSRIRESTDLVAALSGINLSANGAIDEENNLQPQIDQENDDHHNFLFDLQGAPSPMKLNQYLKKPGPSSSHLPSVPKPLYSEVGKDGAYVDQNHSSFIGEGKADLHKPNISSTNLYAKEPMPVITGSGGSPHYQSVENANMGFASYGSGGYSMNQALPSVVANHLGTLNLPPLFGSAAAASVVGSPCMDGRAIGGGLPARLNLTGAAELQKLNRVGNHSAAAALQVPLMDPSHVQYLRTAEYAAQLAGLNDPSLERNYQGSSFTELLGLQKAYLGALLSPQKSQFGVPYLNKTGSLNHGYYGNPAFGIGLSYPGSPLSGPAVPASPLLGSSIRNNERNTRFPSGMRNLAGGVMGSWHPDFGGNLDEGFVSSLLEEFKSNKTRCFELSEIAGHVVEFSADQYGSRFIQQKLETATIEEKNMVFEEISPQALSLMTDVFGNYVIQKFFEHGSSTQRRELANQLTEHVLTLSLQMYGCRVIQKAIEVVDLDQQTKMVLELDGHVMRCVRDQNGNHVIQKCIECIPQDAINFIISTFYDQVVTLSTHPYGCRVIQRVLEHCDDPQTQRIMMDEILQSVCMLAQDQYGNYVIQHVLEHGKPHERSAIIQKLAGQIVHMSQQKFASNVVEKCLSFGGPMERQLLVNEMLGSTDENEPLQVMMKDQYANYVVQKVLETCDDQQRELILSRIKVHLNALKKYTYGKHIVARVEKLVAAGERRMGVQSLYLS